MHFIAAFIDWESGPLSAKGREATLTGSGYVERCPLARTLNQGISSRWPRQVWPEACHSASGFWPSSPSCHGAGTHVTHHVLAWSAQPLSPPHGQNMLWLETCFCVSMLVEESVPVENTLVLFCFVCSTLDASRDNSFHSSPVVMPTVILRRLYQFDVPEMWYLHITERQVGRGVGSHSVRFLSGYSIRWDKYSWEYSTEIKFSFTHQILLHLLMQLFKQVYSLIQNVSCVLWNTLFVMLDFVFLPYFSCFCTLLAWHFLALVLSYFDFLGFDLYLSQNKSHQLALFQPSSLSYCDSEAFFFFS